MLENGFAEEDYGCKREKDQDKCDEQLLVYMSSDEKTKVLPQKGAYDARDGPEKQVIRVKPVHVLACKGDPAAEHEKIGCGAPRMVLVPVLEKNEDPYGNTDDRNR